jgi:hypothetical protein
MEDLKNTNRAGDNENYNFSQVMVPNTEELYFDEHSQEHELLYGTGTELNKYAKLNEDGDQIIQVYPENSVHSNYGLKNNNTNEISRLTAPTYSLANPNDMN